jgi:hypothetical protein
MSGYELYRRPSRGEVKRCPECHVFVKLDGRCKACVRYGRTEIETVPTKAVTGRQIIDAIVARCRGTVS